MKTSVSLLSCTAVSAVLLLAGCGSSSPSSGSTTSGSGVITQGGSPNLGLSASTCYVIQTAPSTGASSIIEIPTFSPSGLPTPAGVLPAPANTPFQAVAVDSTGNIYAGTAGQVLVYSPGSTGAIAPTRTLTGFNFVIAIAVNASGQIYVLDRPASGGTVLSVFAAGANGIAQPILRSSSGALSNGSAVAVDSAGKIYVADMGLGAIEVFAAAAANPPSPPVIAAPTGAIQGANTQLGTPYGVAVDSSGDIFATSANSGTSQPGQILEFAPGANGNVAPIKTVTSQVANSVFGVAVDGAGTRYIVSANPTTGTPLVQEFLPSMSGSSAPWETLSSTSWTGVKYGQVAVF